MAKDDSNERTTYPTTTASSGGLYGSSTTNASGTTYNPSDFEKSLVGTSQSGITNALSQLTNPTYDSADFNKYKSDLQGQQQNGFENNVVNPLISRGLLGTNGVQNLSNIYGNTMNQQTSDLMDKYKAQNSSVLQQLLSTYAMPYDMMKGTTGISNGLASNVANFNSQIYAADQARNAALYQALGTAVGGAASGAGSAFGGGGSSAAAAAAV